MSSRNKTSLAKFLDVVSALEYPEDQNLKRYIERLYKNTVLRSFLDNFSSHISSNNLVIPAQWCDYQTLLENDNVLEMDNLQAATKCAEKDRKKLEQKTVCLEKQLLSAKKHRKRLEKQLEYLESAEDSSTNCLNSLQDTQKMLHSKLNKCRDENKDAHSKYSQSISEINQEFSTFCSDYENESDDLHFLEYVDLDDYLFCEDEYTRQVTKFAKKQFLKVSTCEEACVSDNYELHNIADTVLLQDEADDVKQEILADLRRATLGYPCIKRRVIYSKAELNKSLAMLNLLQNQLTKPIEENYLNRNAKKMAKHTEYITQEIERVKTEILPSLLSKGSPIQRNKILTGNFQLTLMKQRDITDMQKTLIQLLLQQASRISALWMILHLGKTQTSIVSKKLNSLENFFKASYDRILSSTECLLAAHASTDTTNKEPKAVVDKRDEVMLSLHKALVLESNDSLYCTFSSIHKAAKDLEVTASTLSAQSDDNARNETLQLLSDTLQHCYCNQGNTKYCEEELILVPQAIAKDLKEVLESVSDMKRRVPKLLAEIDNKRSYIQNNDQASRRRSLWVDFTLRRDSSVQAI